MRILIVNKFLYPNGGSETYIFELGRELQKMGHEVQYFGMEHEGRVVGNRINSYTSDMDFHAGGIDKLLYPIRIIYSREARRKIRDVLKDFLPDVVHLNNINFQLTPSIIDEIDSFKDKDIKIVYTAHDSQWVCPNHLMMIPSNNKMCFACEGGRYGNCIKNRCIHGSLVKSFLGAIEALIHSKLLKTYSKVDIIICPSHFMEIKLATNPILRDKLVMLHNFLDVQQEYDYKKRDYVLFLGRYSAEKGVKTLLEVCRNVPEIPFVFVGSGPLEEDVNSVSNVKNMGFQKGESLVRLIAEARVCIFPSECNENCPFTVMESQAYGTPILAADVGGVSELMKDGVTGELFLVANQEQLCEKLLELWNNKEKLQRYTENCKHVKFLSLKEYCDKLITVYRM